MGWAPWSQEIEPMRGEVPPSLTRVFAFVAAEVRKLKVGVSQVS